MSRNKLRVGVVGLGMGSNHVRTYQSLPQAELIAVCDSDEPWLRHCQQQWNVPRIFTDYQEMFALEELDAVSIALPTYLHSPATIAALEAGKHVLVEKPMAMDAADAERMAEAAQRSARTLMVSYNQRFNPEIRFLKRCISEGHLGDIYYARTLWRRPLGVLPAPIGRRPTGDYNRNWFNETDKGGGVARDLGSHVIDVAMWLLGFPEVAEVQGCAYTIFGPQSEAHHGFKFDADDHSVGFVRFANGSSLHVEVSFGSHTDQEVINAEFFGSKGGALRSPLKLFGEVAGTYTTVTPRLDEGPASTQAEFVDSILAGRPPIITPEQGIAVMRIIDGIRGQ
jgi:predicted dehydrogenase